ncbi:hypothetical protein [Tritonibacter scottomollicae]|uniref:hypothetical protein n=1 Tax=Tritonibacter scottomollicae TaxID=483013 RepID=UPI003AA99159
MSLLHLWIVDERQQHQWIDQASALQRGADALVFLRLIRPAQKTTAQSKRPGQCKRAVRIDRKRAFQLIERRGILAGVMQAKAKSRQENRVVACDISGLLLGLQGVFDAIRQARQDLRKVMIAESCFTFFGKRPLHHPLRTQKRAPPQKSNGLFI